MLLNYPDNIKQTTGKPRLELLLDFPNALMTVANVREYGVSKYPDRLSYKQIDDDTLKGATLRHIFKDGYEEVDNETNEDHLASAIVNLLMILENRNNRGY